MDLMLSSILHFSHVTHTHTLYTHIYTNNSPTHQYLHHIHHSCKVYLSTTTIIIISNRIINYNYYLEYNNYLYYNLYIICIIKECSSTLYVRLPQAAPSTQYKRFTAISTNWLSEGSKFDIHQQGAQPAKSCKIEINKNSTFL